MLKNVRPVSRLYISLPAWKIDHETVNHGEIAMEPYKMLCVPQSLVHVQSGVCIPSTDEKLAFS